MNNFIEQRIIEAVKKLLSGRVCELIEMWKCNVPLVEFGNYKSDTVVTPDISLSGCEQTEKERIIQVDAYSVTITFSFADTPESEFNCYAYSAAVFKALYDDTTLGGVADRAVISGKKYQRPKTKNCGEGWGLILSLRITVEGYVK
jgi:hypothetical protein